MCLRSEVNRCINREMGKVSLLHSSISEMILEELDEEILVELHGRAAYLYIEDLKEEIENKTLRSETLDILPYHLYNAGHYDAFLSFLMKFQAIKMRIGMFKSLRRDVEWALDLLNDTKDTANVQLNSARANCLNILASIERLYGEYEQARTHFNETISKWEELRSLEPNLFEPEIAVSRHNLGSLLWEMGEFEEAEKEIRKALETRTRLAETSQKEYGRLLHRTLLNLGVILAAEKKQEEARDIFEKALDSLEKNKEQISDYELSLATILQSYGALLEEMREYKDAVNVLHRSVAIQRRIKKNYLDLGSAGLAAALNSLGVTYSSLEQYEKA